VASFPIPLKNKEKVALNYRNEKQATESTPPCIGSVPEPVVSPTGNFCAYRGGGVGGVHGLLETGIEVGNIDKGVTSKPFFVGGGGVFIKETSEPGTGTEGTGGILIVFRTTEFSTTTPIASLVNEGNLNAVGAWAVAAK
jgi:hypothetical protein